jgi:outer membrane protein assembly factor BamB/tetratricopeptide (TPR) repeat protein
MMRLMRRGISLVLLALLAMPVFAQPDAPRGGTLVGEEKRTRDELEVAAKLAANNRYDDAVRRYQQILASSGDALVSLDGEPRRALPVRWLVHERLAALPPEARKLFRNAVEETARKWLEQGTTTRDVRLLEQVVAEAFCSASAEKALHLLGDLAFERGEFEVAEHYWRMLAPFPTQAGAKPEPQAFVLRYPDPADRGALAQAKLILSLIFRGAKDRANRELARFRELHPDAVGEFAGRHGNYAETLHGMLSADTRLAPAAAVVDGNWPSFAGDASRNQVVPAAALPYWPDVPNWVAMLPGDPKAKPHRDSDPPLGTGASAQSLAFHPVIIPGYALVADAARVFAYELGTGKLAAEYDHRKKAGLPESLDLRIPSRTDAAYTLTIAGDCIYARFGVQPMKPPEATAKPRESESVIACLALRRTPAGPMKFELRWQVRARMLDTDPPAAFEGAPLVRDGRLYVARTRFEGRQAVTAVECYDADGARGRNESPVRRWRQEVWSIEVPNEPVRHRHDLLTLAGPNVVYCTHSGAIVALDASSGRRAWAHRYPAAAGRALDLAPQRDLSPCVYADGRVYVAPADADRLLCFEARGGTLLWEMQATQVVQILGASSGKLFATLAGFPRGVRAFDAASGAAVWTVPADGSDQPTFGRGFLTDQFIIWPTSSGLRVLRQEDGDSVDARSTNGPWGNVVLGEGHLVVATPNELWGFVPPRTQLGKWRSETAERPDDAEVLYHLALAEADAGDTDRAATDFHRAAELAGDRRLSGWPLHDLAEHRRFELLLIKAERLWKQGANEAALAVLREASGEAFPTADRVRAWALRRHAGDRATPDLIESSAVRALWITRRDGIPQRADEFLGGVEPVRSLLSGKRVEPSPKRVPDIPIPFRISGVELSPAREWPLTPFCDPGTGEEGPPADAEGRVILGGPRRAICRTLDDGKIAWSAALGHDAAAYAFSGDSVVVAGPDGISRLRRTDGALVWQFFAPDPSRMPTAFPQAPFRRLEPWPTRERFSAFRLSGSRLFVRRGIKRLVALDAETGRPVWQFHAPGAQVRTAESSGLSEHYLAGADHLLLQSTGGEMLALSAADGRLMYCRPATLPWPHPPLLLDAGRAVYANGPRLHAIGLETGTEQWSYLPARDSSLSGAAPQFHRDGNDLLLVVERNYGYELERVQLADGKPDLRPQTLGRSRPDLARAAITAEVYAIPTAGGEIIALGSGAGEQRWTLKVSNVGEPWRVRATQSELLLHPEHAVPRADLNAVMTAATREFAGIPSFASLQSAANMTFAAWSRRTFPVLAASPSDGRKLQELSIPANGPTASVVLSDRSAIIVGGRMALIER